MEQNLKCQVCGVESDYGCHGLKNGEVYDEYYCERCYNRKKRGDLNEHDLGSKSEVHVHLEQPVSSVPKEQEECRPQESSVGSTVTKRAEELASSRDLAEEQVDLPI